MCRAAIPAFPELPSEGKWPELQQEHFAFKTLSWDHIDTAQNFLMKENMPKLEEALADVEVPTCTCIDMSSDTCGDVHNDMCSDMNNDMHSDMCSSVCMGMCQHVHRHVYELWYKPCVPVCVSTYALPCVLRFVSSDNRLSFTRWISSNSKSCASHVSRNTVYLLCCT